LVASTGTYERLLTKIYEIAVFYLILSAAASQSFSHPAIFLPHRPLAQFLLPPIQTNASKAHFFDVGSHHQIQEEKLGGKQNKCHNVHASPHYS